MAVKYFSIGSYMFDKIMYRQGYREGQLSILNAVIAQIDNDMDLLIDQLSVHKKAGSKNAILKWEAQVQVMDDLRSRLETARDKLPKNIL